ETYQYNGQQLPSQIEKTGHQTEVFTETLSYDTFGNITERTLATDGLAPRTTSYQYDTSGRFMVTQTDVEGLQTRYSYNQSTGLLLSETDPYDRQTTYTYDVWGKQTRVTDYLGKKTTYSYSRSHEGYRIAQSGEDGSFSVSIYDKLHGGLIETGVGTLSGMAYQRMEYDAIGRKVRESEPYYGSAPSQWNTISYDAYGRIGQTTAYTGKVTNISYNGLTTTVSDGTQTTVTTKDAMGNVIRHTDNGGTIAYTYYANGHLKQSDYDGVIVSIQQDGWRRKTKLSDPSAGTYTYQYNGFGEITEATTPKGTTTYTYDSQGKLTKKEISGDATVPIAIGMTLEYHYDPESKQLTAIHGLSNGNSFVYEYGYDSDKRPIRMVEQTPYAQFERQWQYDSFGRVEKEGYTALHNSDGKTVTKWIRHHYKNGFDWQITDDVTGDLLWQTGTINARGQLTEGMYGNGIIATKAYDAYGLPLLYSHDKDTGAGMENLMLLAFDFNPQKGTLDSRSSSLFNWQEDFSYDNLDRLTGFTDHNGSYEQVYDNRGRITQNQNIGEYSYSNTHPYQATQVALTEQGYDYYKQRGKQSIVYNAFKKPVSISIEGRERIDFYYNPFKGRSAMFYGSDAEDITERPLQKYYAADGSMEIKSNTATGETEFILYIGGDAYSAPVVLKSDGQASAFLYLHRDYLGSIVAITGQEGTLLEKRHFDAWGNISHAQDGKGTPLPLGEVGPGLILDRGYTGHEHLQGVGLIHMNGRLYDPLLHRFLAPDNYVQDPYNTQNFNRYGYVYNNPLMYTDITGEWFGIDDAIAFVIGGTVNLVVNAVQGNINSWGDGFAAFGAGGAAGTLALYGPAGWVAGGAILGGTNAYLSGGDLGTGIFTGAISGLAGGAVGQWAAQGLGNLMINGLNIASPILKGAVSGMIGGGAGGFASGFALDLVMGGNLESALNGGWQGAKGGFVTGGIAGGVGGYASAKANGINPWNGKVKNYPPNEGFKGNSTTEVLQPGERIDRYGRESGKYVSPEGTPFEQRSLPQSKINDPYAIYEVQKPFPVQKGEVAPWFFQKGGGIQYKLPYSVKWLVENGYLKPY
ncbi:MAG: glycohydrolase toxin TNT-related protein, partial [Bacteroidota bacterium]